MAVPSLSDLPPPPEDKTGWPWTEATPPVSQRVSDGSPWPTISIVTPSYNQGQFLERTIRSVLLQGYSQLEYIVIDGGSTDGSVGILERYSPWIDYWVSEGDRGQSHAINKGFEQASGEIFAWLNSDDFYLDGALEKVGHYFNEKPTTDVLVGEAKKVKTSGETVYTATVPELTLEGFLKWRNGGNFLQPASFFRRDAWSNHGPLREDLHYCMDVDLWLKMVQTEKFEGIPVELAQATHHSGAKTSSEDERTAVEVGLLITEYGGFEIARRDLMEMADDLVETRRKLLRVTTHPLYQYVIGPIYHWLRTRSSPSNGHDPEE